jgi:hypothetical protein
LLSTSKEFSDILCVEKPRNVNDLYFILQFPRNEVKKYKNSNEQVKSSSTSALLSRHTQRKITGNLNPANKKNKNSVIETRHNILPSIQLLSNPTQTINSNKEISNNLDVQSSLKKRKNSQYNKMKLSNMQSRSQEYSLQTWQNFNPNKANEEVSELQPPPAKKHKNSTYDNKMKQNNISQLFSPPVQSNFDQNRKISSNLDVRSKKRRSSFEEVQRHPQIQQHNVMPTNVQPLSNSGGPVKTTEGESSKFSFNFRNELKNFFETSNFTVIGSKYIESQKVITFLKEMGGKEVVAKDPRINCVLVSYLFYLFYFILFYFIYFFLL